MNTPNEQVISELKNKHGKYLKLIEIPECDKCCVIKVPGRKEISAATAAMKGNAVKFTESIMKNCFIWGDDPFGSYDDHDEYYLAVSLQVSNIVDIKDGEIKNL